MYRISKKFHFSAAHRLDLGPEHPCSTLHGHNYTVEVILGAEDTDERGMVIDFHELVSFGKVVDSLDHKFLNEEVDFHTTTENLACWLFDYAESIFGDMALAVRVSESGKTWAEYAR